MQNELRVLPCLTSLSGVLKFFSAMKAKLNPLTPEEERIIVHKGTEMPYSGEYVNSRGKGTYICRRCEAPLYKSEDKFDSTAAGPASMMRSPAPSGARWTRTAHARRSPA